MEDGLSAAKFAACKQAFLKVNVWVPDMFAYIVCIKLLLDSMLKQSVYIWGSICLEGSASRFNPDSSITPLIKPRGGPKHGEG